MSNKANKNPQKERKNKVLDVDTIDSKGDNSDKFRLYSDKSTPYNTLQNRT